MERLPDLSALFADKDSLLRTLHALAQELRARLERLEGESAKLRGQRARDSTNSSRPPSSDGPRKKTRSLRTKSGQPPGGVAGLLPVLQPQTPAPVLGIHRTHAQVYFAGRCDGQVQTDFYQPAILS